MWFLNAQTPPSTTGTVVFGCHSADTSTQAASAATGQVGAYPVRVSCSFAASNAACKWQRGCCSALSGNIFNRPLCTAPEQKSLCKQSAACLLQVSAFIGRCVLACSRARRLFPEQQSGPDHCYGIRFCDFCSGLPVCLLQRCDLLLIIVSLRHPAQLPRLAKYFKGILGRSCCAAGIACSVAHSALR